MQTALFILQLIPTIIAIIKSVEEAIPVSGAGKDKLDAVLQMVQDACPRAVEVVPQVVKIINTLVGLFNKTGVFAKGIA